MTAPAGNRHDLGVIGSADDDRLSSRRLGLSHQTMDALNIGAGSIYDPAPLLLQRVMDPLGLAVRAKNDRRSVWDLFHRANQDSALPLQFRHHMVVVDHRTQQHGVASPSGLLCHLNRTLYTIAEAGRLGQFDPHTARSPSLWIRSMRSAVMASYSSAVPFRLDTWGI